MPSEPILWYAYANYPELCSYFGVPVKKGGAKKKQLEHWRECFDWELEGHKFIITEVYSPLTPRVSHYHEYTKWYPNLSKIILAMTKYALYGYGVDAFSVKHRELIITSTNLYELVGLCNRSFKKLKKGWKDKSDLSDFVKKRCYREISERLYHIVTRVLRSLKKQEIIACTRPYIVDDSLGPNRLATPEEEKTIIDLRAALLLKYGVKSEFYIIGSKHEEKFYEELNNNLSNIYPQLRSCYKVHRIRFHDDYKIKPVDYLFTYLGCDIFKQQINDTIVDDLSLEKYEVPHELIQSAIRQKYIEEDLFENIKI